MTGMVSPQRSSVRHNKANSMTNAAALVNQAINGGTQTRFNMGETLN